MANATISRLLELSRELRFSILDHLLAYERTIYHREDDPDNSVHDHVSSTSERQANAVLINVLLVNKQLCHEVQIARASMNNFTITVSNTLQGQSAVLPDTVGLRVKLENAKSVRIAGYSGARARHSEPDYSFRIILRQRADPGYRVEWQHHVARNWVDVPDGRYERMVSEVTSQTQIVVKECEKNEGARGLTFEGMGKVIEAFHLG